jgi:hypothetical protein
MASATVDPGAMGEDHVYLLARSSLDDYLSFMGAYAADGSGLDRQPLADEWRAAAELMTRLRRTEAKWADDAPLRPLPAAMKSLLSRVQADPMFVRAFADAPCEFGLVELDRLVASQKLVCTDHMARLKARLGPSPSPEDVFRFCLPYDHPPTEFRAGRITDDSFAFISDSSDLRFLEAVMLRPEHVTGYQAVGPVAGVVALVVGFGSNYLNVVAANGRLILNNGHHRACALRDLGVTHAPVVVQRVTHPDEVELLAPRAVQRNPDLYLNGPRPPVLKDYFDPRLSRTVRLAMTTKEVRVRFSIEELDMP